MIQGVVDNIDFSILKGEAVAGPKILLHQILNIAGINYTVFGERAIYECRSLIPLDVIPTGNKVLATVNDLKSVTEMFRDFRISEFNEDNIHKAQQLMIEGIEKSSILLWKENDDIKSRIKADASNYNTWISFVFTRVEYCDKSYGAALLHNITSEMLNTGCNSLWCYY